MNPITGLEADELFGGEVSPAVRHLIEQVRQVPRQQGAVLLRTAALSAPGDLPVYYLLYKLHASLGELAPALEAATQGLAVAAQAAGLPTDWTLVQPGDADFGQPGPARFWLFTLKAIAFIRLRQGQPDITRGLLHQIQRLDPQDLVGASVIDALLEHSA